MFLFVSNINNEQHILDMQNDAFYLQIIVIIVTICLVKANLKHFVLNELLYSLYNLAFM